MADLDDMETVECPVCGRKCPRDFYPLCNCAPAKSGKAEAKKKTSKPKKTKKH